KDYWTEVFPDTRGTPLEPLYRRAMAERVAGELDYYHLAWQRWFTVRVYPIEAGGITIYFQDITAAKEGELKLEASETRLQALLMASSDVIYRMSADWSELAPLDGHDFLVTTAAPTRTWLEEYIHPDDQVEVSAVIGEAIRTKSKFELEHRVRRKDGTYGWTFSRAIPRLNATGEIVEWFGAASDITARVEGNHALQKVNGELDAARVAAERGSRAKDDFLAALSHELRTPLTPVLIAAASLREDKRLPDDVREQLSMMERNIALEARLIDDLLDVTSISRGKLKLRTQPCDAHSLVGLAIDIVREDARLKGITIEREFVARRSGLAVDPARFQQIIWNVLRNAVKFTPQDGRITVCTRDGQADDGSLRLRIEIADSGIGIEPRLLEQIFRPFDQGDLTGPHRFGGLGLGLAIARAVVDLHGGAISAQSQGLTHGATFVIELPDAFEPGAGVTNLATPLVDDPLLRLVAPVVQALRILLVEDHEPTLQTICRLLQRDGHHVVVASTVAAAVAAGDKSTFDYVISDLGLPDGSGNELMGTLRERYGLRGIALSGYGTEEDLLRSTAAGFIVHLVKPVPIAELRRAIAALPRIA
ncbi:MAG: ATP-binding protein, partial [Opitutus sp.]